MVGNSGAGNRMVHLLHLTATKSDIDVLVIEMALVRISIISVLCLRIFVKFTKNV